MRLDLFLKSSRLCLRRTVAQKMCDAGLISVNGKVAKAATTVKAGDELSLRRRDRITTIRVLAWPAASQTSRREATLLYEVISEVRAAGE
jgi:ribosomal 50S subunit-recycling heat shock protein